MGQRTFKKIGKKQTFYYLIKKKKVIRNYLREP